MGWRRWIQLVCLLLSAAPACADGARPHEASAVPVAAAADAEAPAARRNHIWRVSSPGSTVYLLGSIHFGRPEMYPLSSAIDQAYARADALVVEADVTAIDPEQTDAWMAAKAMYRDGTTLEQHLPPELWRFFLFVLCFLFFFVVVVGAAHLVGEQGIVELLRARGYTVARP